MYTVETIWPAGFAPHGAGALCLQPQGRLTGVDLAGVPLMGANLCQADLTDANFKGADVSEANLGWPQTHQRP